MIYRRRRGSDMTQTLMWVGIVLVVLDSDHRGV